MSTIYTTGTVDPEALALLIKEHDALKDSLQKSAAEISRMMQANARQAATIAEQDKVLEQALDTLQHVQWKNWRTDNAITAIQEQLKP